MRLGKVIAAVREKLCSLLAWEKQYASKERSFKDRIRRALEQAIANTPTNPSEVVMVAEGFGPWCLAEYGGQDVIGLQRLDGRIQVFHITLKREKAFR